jgi:hypothetical protein
MVRPKPFHLASTLPPTFLFLPYSVVKEQTPQNNVLDLSAFRLRARLSVAHAALLISETRANYSAASGVPPSLWGVYSRRLLLVSTAIPIFFEFFATASPAV